MGFRSNSYATVWSVVPVSDTITKARISITRKDKTTGEFVQDFGGFVSFIGTATAQKALSLKEKDRIKLGDTDVHSFYNKEKDVTYYNFNIFGFDLVESKKQTDKSDEPQPSVDDGEVDVISDDRLPF